MGDPSVAAAADLDRLRAERIETRNLPVSPASVDDVSAAGWTLDELWLPAVVLRRDALRHNLDRFPAWSRQHGLSHAPHGKTTMAPQLWAAQLKRGAWGLTAATVDQARAMRRFGVSRVLIANEVVDPSQLDWLAGVHADPAFEPYLLVDSVAALRAVEHALTRADAPHRLPVLVELGVPGQRTGARGVVEALELASRVAGSSWVRLAGVEAYEGVLTRGRDPEAVAAAREFLGEFTSFATDCDRRGLFASGSDTSAEIIVTAGGSAYFDLVAEAIAGMPELSRPVHGILRSGCSLTHDHLSYDYSSPLRGGADPDPLQPALAAYARVLSCPEPGLALLGAGRRDVPYDIELPVPLTRYRDGRATGVGERARITALNDHHAFCAHGPGFLQVGDTVELGLAHPCTTFDKWPLIPVVDDEHRVIDAVRTLF